MSARVLAQSDGGYYSPFAQVYSQYGRRPGWWVILSLSKVSYGMKWDCVSYDAIVDDFGDLVAVADQHGKVVLS